MGSIIEYDHQGCKFKYVFYEGVGFSLFRLQGQARSKMRSGEWGEAWKSLMEKYPEGTATLNNALCYCPRCRKYFSEPRVEFYIPNEGYHYQFDEQDKDRIPEYIINSHYHVLQKETITCPDCDAEVTVMEDLEKVPCPVCGEMIRGRDAGNWD